MDKELVSSNEYDEFVAKLPPEEQAIRVQKARTHKYETILEMWEEYWMSCSPQDMRDELLGLNTGEKPLYQFDDDELENEYQRAVLYFANKDKEQK